MKAKNWNQYNQVSHQTQDTICESDKNTRKYHPCYAAQHQAKHTTFCKICQLTKGRQHVHAILYLLFLLFDTCHLAHTYTMQELNFPQ